MGMKSMIRLSMVFGLLASMLLSCTPQQKAIARTVVDVTNTACLLFKNVEVTPGLVQDICVTEAEIAPFLKELLKERKLAAANAAASASAK